MYGAFFVPDIGGLRTADIPRVRLLAWREASVGRDRRERCVARSEANPERGRPPSLAGEERGARPNNRIHRVTF